MTTFNSNEFQWSNLRVFLLGRPVSGIQGLRYSVQQDKRYVYGQGNEPRLIQAGNRQYRGNLQVLQSELEAMIAASPQKDLLLMRFDVVVSYVPHDNRLRMVTDVLKSCEVNEVPKALRQNDPYMQVDLPFLFVGLQHQA